MKNSGTILSFLNELLFVIPKVVHCQIYVFFIICRILHSTVYDKRDDCRFPIVNIPFVDSNITACVIVNVCHTILERRIITITLYTKDCIYQINCLCSEIENWFQLLKKFEIAVVRPPYTVHWEYRSGVAHINWAGESCAYEAAVLGPLLSRKYIFWYANLFPVCFSIQWSRYAYLIFLLVVPLMNKTLWYKCHWICCQ